MAQYDIPEKIGKEYSTVFRQLKKMRKKKLVKVVATITSKKRGKDKDIFSLTLFGWLVCYGQNVLSVENVPYLVEALKEDVPLVFGEWDYFEKEGVKEIAEKHLVNTMKVCFSKYLSLLANADVQIKIRKKDNPNFPKTEFWKDFYEVWLTEKRWAKQLTDVFLYHGFKINNPFEYTLDIDMLTVDEKEKLRKAFNRNMRLYFYRTVICRQDNTIPTILDIASPFDFGMKSFIEFRNKFFNPIDCSDKIANLMSLKFKEEGKSKNISPFLDISNLIYNQNYFFATLKVCELYLNYPFLNWEEFFTAILDCMIGEADSMVSHIHLRSEINKTKISTTRKDNYKSAMLEILAALTFFDIEPIQVWDTTFYQMKANAEKYGKLLFKKKGLVTGKILYFYKSDESIEQAKKKTLPFIQNQLEQLRTQHSDLSLYELSKVYVRKQFEKS